MRAPSARGPVAVAVAVAVVVGVAAAVAVASALSPSGFCVTSMQTDTL